MHHLQALENKNSRNTNKAEVEDEDWRRVAQDIG